MSLLPWFVGAAVVFVLLSAFAYEHLAYWGLTPEQMQATVQARYGMGVKNTTIGIPAIKPHLNLDAADPAQASLPTFTAADVTAFVLANPPSTLSNTDRLTAGDITVQFMTDAQAGTVLDNISIGLAATAPVCVVQIRGNFQSTFVPGRPPAGYTAPVVPFAYQVFDARNGNLLVEGGRKAAFL
jgi:hypothetical protein